MNKEQWADIKKRIGTTHERVSLLCDGYLVSPRIQRVGMKLIIVVYVNGYIKGENWWHGKESDIEQMGDIARKFHHWKYRPRPAKEIKQLEAVFGKRECKKRGFYDAWISTTPYFSTPAAFIAHIRKHCQSIEEITREEHEERLAALEAAV
jgi:hypothetical protein